MGTMVSWLMASSSCYIQAVYEWIETHKETNLSTIRFDYKLIVACLMC